MIAKVGRLCFLATEQKRLRTKTLPVLGRIDKCLDHLCLDEVAVELIHFRQPEIVTRIRATRYRVVVLTSLPSRQVHEMRSIRLAKPNSHLSDFGSSPKTRILVPNGIAFPSLS